MRTQAEREEKTLAIATALALFVVILAFGMTAVATVGSLDDPWAETAIKASVLLGLLASSVYLVRHRRG